MGRNRASTAWRSSWSTLAPSRAPAAAAATSPPPWSSCSSDSPPPTSPPAPSPSPPPAGRRRTFAGGREAAPPWSRRIRRRAGGASDRQLPAAVAIAPPLEKVRRPWARLAAAAIDGSPGRPVRPKPSGTASAGTA